MTPMAIFAVVKFVGGLIFIVLAYRERKRRPGARVWIILAVAGGLSMLAAIFA